MGSAPKAPSLVTKQQYDASVADWMKNNAPYSAQSAGFHNKPEYADALQGFKDSMSVLPPPAPDLADETVQRARQAARRKLLMGGLTGPLDLTGASTTAKLPGLGGT